MRHDSGSTCVQNSLFRIALAACAALLLMSWLPAAAQRNARVMRFNAAQLSQAADTIVSGKVTAARVEAHPQFPQMKTLVVTVEITEVWKGQTGAPFSFRQYITDMEDIRTKLNYKIGQEILLFMTRPSKYGLSSPVGLAQGRFRITYDANGNRRAINDAQNFGLFSKMDQTNPKVSAQLSPSARTMIAQHRSGAVGYHELKSIVEATLTTQAN